MKRSLYLRANLFAGNEGTLLLRLSEALQQHSIDPESLVFSSLSSGTEFRVSIVLAPCDARWLEVVADQFRKIPSVTSVATRDEDAIEASGPFTD